MSPTSTFHRSRFTWLGYLMLAYYSYMQSNPGPIMPFLRDELELSYTIASLHFSAFALGMIIAGATADRVAAKLGRYPVFWGGAAGMALGGIGFATGSSAIITILSAFVMGTIGSFALVMIQSTLADAHKNHSAIALTEANALAGVGMVAAPLMVGVTQRGGLGWGASLLVGVVLLLLLWLFFRQAPFPPASVRENPHQQASTPLSSLFWIYWGVVFLVVCIEWSIISWGADFLENSVGLSKVNASTGMSIFFGAFLLGRVAGSRLTRHIAPDRLLVLTLGLVALGFIPFWLAPLPLVNLIGLFITGLGASNLFPMTLSVISGLVLPEQSDTASGRVALGAGTAILIAPQVLGTLADQVGITQAYGVVAVLLVAAMSMVWWANQQVSTRHFNPLP